MKAAKNQKKLESKGNDKRSRKRVTLLQLAAVQMNRRGAVAVVPAVVGAEAGMSRSSVYYYFPDKTALALACYEDSVTHLERACEEAISEREGTVSQLNRFVRGMLSEEAHSVAVMSNLSLIGEDEAEKLRSRTDQCFLCLQELIEAGIASGQLRTFSPELAAGVLMGLIEWKRLWCAFLASPAVQLTSAADDICRWLQQGILTEEAFLCSETPDLRSVIGSDVDVMNPIAVSEQKRNHLVGAASSLFNRNGIDSTTIDDIARCLGTTKGFVYHYIEDKEHLVRMCYDRAFDLFERIWEVSHRYDVEAAASLQIAMNLNCQAQLSAFPPLMVQAGLGRLPSIYRRRATKLWDLFAKDTNRAVTAGTAHPMTERLVDISAGAFNWLGKGNFDNSSKSILAADVTAIFSLGLQAQN